MKGTAENIEKVVVELNKISKSEKLDGILTEINELTENINAAFSKEDLDKISTILTNLESFSSNLKGMLEDDTVKTSLVGTLEESKSTFEKSNNLLTTLFEIKVLTSVDFGYIEDADSTVYNLNIDFWLDEAYLNVGFGNYFGDDKLINIIMGMPFNDYFMFKYGVIKSDPGIGIDYRVNGFPFVASLDIYNFDEPNMDFLLKYSMFKYFSINAGYNAFNLDTRADAWCIHYSKLKNE